MTNNQHSKKDLSPIDYPSVLERTGGDESFLEELLDLYSKEFSEKFDQINKALAKENYEQLLMLGHNLKGSSANLSLTSLKEASFEMEMAGRERNITKAKKASEQLNREFQRLQRFLAEKKTKN